MPNFSFFPRLSPVPDVEQRDVIPSVASRTAQGDELLMLQDETDLVREKSYKFEFIIDES